MAEESAKLRIPYIAAAQAQKHVTHNEGVTLLDTLLQLSVLDKDLTAPPAEPAEGDTYIVAGTSGGATGTGAWEGWDARVVRYIDGEWRSYLPGAGDGAGWLAWVMDEDAMYRFDGEAWALAGIEGPQGPAGPAGADGEDGADGADGQSFQPDAVVALIAGRDAYDDEAAAFSVLVVSDAGNDDKPTLYFKLSAGSADWSDPITWAPEGGGGTREELTGARTYYVNGASGSDSNDGLSSGAGAFATIQKAMDTISADLDLGPYNVTVQIEDGTYTAGLTLKSYRATSGYVTFQGNAGTPANVLISTSGNCVNNAAGATGKFVLKDFKVTSSGTRNIHIFGPGMVIEFANLDFGSSASTQLLVEYKAFAQATGDFAISGNAVVSIWAGRGGLIFLSSRTITYSNSPAFSARNFHAGEQGWIDGYNMTFTNGNTVTGKRYEISGLAGIFTNGGGSSYLPGSTAGSTANGGQYY